MPDSPGDIAVQAEVKHHYALNFARADEPSRVRAMGLRFVEFVEDSAEKWARQASCSPSGSPARLRPSFASVRKSLGASLTDEPPVVVSAQKRRSPPQPAVAAGTSRQAAVVSAGRTPRRAAPPSRRSGGPASRRW